MFEDRGPYDGRLDHQSVHGRAAGAAARALTTARLHDREIFEEELGRVVAEVFAGVRFPTADDRARAVRSTAQVLAATTFLAATSVSLAAEAHEWELDDFMVYLATQLATQQANL